MVMLPSWTTFVTALALSSSVSVAFPTNTVRVTEDSKDTKTNLDDVDAEVFGIYYTQRFANGTEISINLLDSSAPPIVANGLTSLDAPVPGSDRDPTLSAKAIASRRQKQKRDADTRTTLNAANIDMIMKRGAQCWQYIVDKYSCDDAFYVFYEWIRALDNGYLLDTATSLTRTAMLSVFRGSVRVYFCLNEVNQLWRVYDRDIDKGMYEMDHTCRLYEAGYWHHDRWDYRRFGKADVNQILCPN